MDFMGTALTFFKNGGPFMFPISVVAVIGIAIAIERYLFLRRSHKDNRTLWTQLTPLMNQGELEKACKQAAESDTAIGRVLSHGLSRAGGDNTRDDVESAMEESLMEVTPLLEKRTHYLATFANIATLLGLLGTIMGLIQGFNAVANVNPAEKADALSASISVAMNTTAFGLMVAIPLLFLHTWLSTKTNELLDSLEMGTVKFLNIINPQR